MQDISQIILEIHNDRNTKREDKLLKYGTKYPDEFKLYPTVFKAAIMPQTDIKFLLSFVEQSKQVNKQNYKEQFAEAEFKIRNKFGIDQSKSLVDQEYRIV